MILVITGSRRHKKGKFVRERLDELVQSHGVPNMVVLGDASGVDKCAKRWCSDRGYAFVEHVARWEELGKEAGPTRNQAMIDSAKALETIHGGPVHCMGFPQPNSKGTWDCIRRAREAGFKVAILKCP